MQGEKVNYRYLEKKFLEFEKINREETLNKISIFFN